MAPGFWEGVNGDESCFGPNSWQTVAARQRAEAEAQAKPPETKVNKATRNGDIAKGRDAKQARAHERTLGSARPKPEPTTPGVVTVPSTEQSRLFGNKRLAENTNLGLVTLGKVSKTLTKAMEKMANEVWVKEGGSDLFGASHFAAATWAKVQDRLAKGSAGYSPENDDNNYQLYPKADTKGFVDYLKAQAGKGGKVFMAEWDDQSTEYLGLSVVVQRQTPEKFVVANVITFKM